jgi:DDE family transposase
MPCGTVGPNSLARPRRAFASIVRCLTSKDRAERKARVPCWSKLLAGTNLALGRDAAARIAAASAASFFLPSLTKGLTASGAISLTSWPSPASRRARWGAAPQASMTSAQASCSSKNGISSPRRSLRLIAVFPAPSTAWTWKTGLAVSRPIMVMLMAGGSSSAGPDDPCSGTLAPSGRPPHLSRRGGGFAGRQPGGLAGRGPLHLVLDRTGLQLLGQGEWDEEKHGRARRGWRKLHLGADAVTGEIAAQVLTEGSADDAAQAPAPLGRAEGTIAGVTADGACDGEPVHRAAAARQRDPTPTVVTPPRASAVAGTNVAEASTQRDRHIRLIAEEGRMGWQEATGYGRRDHAEAAIGRHEASIGPRLRARTLPTQRGEVALGVQAPNRMIRVAKPVYIRLA